MTMTSGRSTTPAPISSEGFLQPDDSLVCASHASRFDLSTGTPVNLPAYVPIETFPVRVEDGVIRVEVE